MVQQTTLCAALPRRAAASAAPEASQEPKESFSWGKALALPAYVYGPLSGALSAATGFADRFPAGGFTINPGQGIHLNPDWTRHLAQGTILRTAQPIVAGLTAVLLAARGLAELNEGRNLAGALDLGAAAASAGSILSPSVGGMAGLALITARGLVDLHQA